MTDPAHSRFKPVWLILAAFTLSITLWYPLGLDNGVYQSMAEDFLYYGKWQYLGSWDQNFPGNLVLHLISISLFGNSDIGFRCFDYVLQIGVCFILYRFFRLWLKPRTAWIAIMIYLFFYIRAGTEVMGQRDVYAFAATLWATYLILKQAATPKLVTLIVAGLCCGVAVTIRPTYVLYPLLLIAIVPGIRNIQSAVVLLAASALPLLMFIALYSLKPNGLHEMYLATIRFNVDVYTKFGAPFSWFRGGLIVLPFYVLLLALLWVGLTYFKRQYANSIIANATTTSPNRTTYRIYWSFLILTLALIIVQRKFLAYHFAPYVMLLLPFAALGAEAVLKLVSSRFQIPLFVTLGLLIAWPRTAILNAARAASEHRSALSAFDSTIDPGTMIGYTKEQAAVAYLNRPETRHDRIEVMGFDSRLRAHLARNSATRFTMLHSIGFRPDTSLHGSELAYAQYQRDWRKEFMDSLVAIKPQELVIVHVSNAWYLHDAYEDVLHLVPRFDSLMTAGYRFDTAIGGFQIYKRR